MIMKPISDSDNVNADEDEDEPPPPRYSAIYRSPENE